MKYTILLFTTALLLVVKTFAQTGVAINTTGDEPDGSAMLDVTSTTKGLLIPRMTQEQRDDISTPAEGLMIFQTDEISGFYFFQSSWKFVGTGIDYSQLINKPGNATTTNAGFMSATDKIKLDATATGTASGQMQYWNGSAWVIVAAGQNGQILKYKNGIPTWVDDNIENLSIGDYYKGGIIGYFLQPGDPGYNENVRHGLIVAPTEQGSFPWGCNGMHIDTTSQEIGTGAANTAAIVAGCSETGIAAKICSDLVLNGYDDWFLPSNHELFQLSQNHLLIGGFNHFSYWTSSEYNDYFAYEARRGQPLDYYVKEKSELNQVRAVRSF